jgi:hypothetical protein
MVLYVSFEHAIAFGVIVLQQKRGCTVADSVNAAYVAGVCLPLVHRVEPLASLLEELEYRGHKTYLGTTTVRGLPELSLA